MHGGGWIFILLDFMLSAERLYYKSAIWPVLLGTVFTVWTGIFAAAGLKNDFGKPYVYAVYDWKTSVTGPIILYFVSLVILIIFTSLWTFIKNLILIRSNVGKRCAACNAERNSGKGRVDLEMQAGRSNTNTTTDAGVEVDI